MLADFVHEQGVVGGIKDIATSDNLDVHVCSQDPTTYLEATATYSLGVKVDAKASGPADGTASGRKITIDGFVGAPVTSTGTATHIALVDTANSVLLATSALAASTALTLGQSWDMNSFDIESTDP